MPLENLETKLDTELDFPRTDTRKSWQSITGPNKTKFSLNRIYSQKVPTLQICIKMRQNKVTKKIWFWPCEYELSRASGSSGSHFLEHCFRFECRSSKIITTLMSNDTPWFSVYTSLMYIAIWGCKSKKFTCSFSYEYVHTETTC